MSHNSCLICYQCSTQRDGSHRVRGTGPTPKYYSKLGVHERFAPLTKRCISIQRASNSQSARCSHQASFSGRYRLGRTLHAPDGGHHEVNRACVRISRSNLHVLASHSSVRSLFCAVWRQQQVPWRRAGAWRQSTFLTSLLVASCGELQPIRTRDFPATVSKTLLHKF
jgi:hypothetical protein